MAVSNSRRLLLLAVFICVYRTISCTSDITTTNCSDLLVCAVKNTENGTTVFCSVPHSAGQASNFTLDIPGHYLPSLECGDDYTGCALASFVQGSTVNVFVPSVGGFLNITYREGETLQYQFKQVSRPCNPTSLFSLMNNLGLRLVMSCFNFTLQGDEKGSLYFVEFDNRTGVLLQTRRFSRRLGLGPPNVASIVVLGRDLQGCLFHQALYTVHNENLLYVSTDVDQYPDFTFGDPIPNFSQINDIEYNSGDDNLILYSDRNCVQVDVCANTHDHFSRESFYRCKNTNLVLTYKDDRLGVSVSGVSNRSDTSISFPVGTLIHGRCIGLEHGVMFWGLAKNGSLYSVNITGGDHTVFKLVSAVCSEDAPCLRPVYEEDSGLFGSFFDPDQIQVSVVNFTFSCGWQDVALPFHPDMFIVTPLPGEHVCHCSMSTETPTSAVPVGPIIGGAFASILLPVGGAVCIVLVILIVRQKDQSDGGLIDAVYAVSNHGDTDLEHGQELSVPPTVMDSRHVASNYNGPHGEERDNDMTSKANEM